MDSEISETVKAAKLYLSNLNDLHAEIHCAEKQILTTFDETEKCIRETFSNLKKNLCDSLEKREQMLLKKATKAKSDGLLPLTQCASVIKKNIEITTHLINQGSQVRKLKPEQITDVLEKGSLLGNLPEVPESKEVPYISFYFEPFYETDIKNLCLSIGEVFRIAPIQIKSLSPKPGAILIEWQQSCENNEEKIRDIQEFRLQRAFGDVVKNKTLTVNFLDCYKGVDTQYLLRDIQICQPYSFRICCKFDGTSEWSPWSVAQVGLTTLHWFSWESSENCILTNENKIVRTNDDGEGIVFSDGAQVGVGDAVEFTILDIDQKSEAVLALIQSKDTRIKKLKDYEDGAFLIDNDGRIFIDNVEKSTVLPKFTKGLKVCFSLEKIHQGKIRINVDSSDKRVTYDWFLNDNPKVFFACQIAPQWKIMVE